jgi:hypothetical protein
MNMRNGGGNCGYRTQTGSGDKVVAGRSGVLSPTPTDSGRTESGVELRTGVQGTAISVFQESLSRSVEFDGWI